MRQTTIAVHNLGEVNNVPAGSVAIGKTPRGNGWTERLRRWHRNCSKRKGNSRATTERSWTLSRPNSRNTGSPDSFRPVTTQCRASGMIRCRPPSRKHGKSSRSGSTQPVASTRPYLFAEVGVNFAVPIGRIPTLRTIRSPLPASSSRRVFLCPGARPPIPIVRGSEDERWGKSLPVRSRRAR